jgi:integrase
MKKKRQVETGIWSLESGGYLVDLSMPGNKNERVRKKHKTQSEARNYKIWVQSNWNNDPEWSPKTAKQDSRRLKALIDVWYTDYGQFLKDGKRRKTKLNIIADQMENPIARKIDKAMFSDFRTKRAEQVKPKTINNEHGYLCSLFNKLIELGKWPYKNPIEGIGKLRLKQTELAYLEDAEIESLLAALQVIDSEVALIAEVCLSTGARWSEAQSLQLRQVKNHTVYITETKTGINRSVEIDDDLYNRLRKRGPGYLFRQSQCWKVFRRGMWQAGIDLPEGQMTHVLRHTFATHFLSNYQAADGLLRLKNILGHTNIKTTEQYLHIIAAKNAGTARLNPVSMLKQKRPILTVVK